MILREECKSRSFGVRKGKVSENVFIFFVK